MVFFWINCRSFFLEIPAENKGTDSKCSVTLKLWCSYGYWFPEYPPLVGVFQWIFISNYISHWVSSVHIKHPQRCSRKCDIFLLILTRCILKTKPSIVPVLMKFLPPGQIFGLKFRPPDIHACTKLHIPI